MRVRRALAIGVLGALLLMTHPAAPALACSDDDDCDWQYSAPGATGPAGAFGYDGPIGPNAQYDGNVFTWFDGSTTDRYVEPVDTRPSLWDSIVQGLERTINAIERLIDPPDWRPADNSGVRG